MRSLVALIFFLGVVVIPHAALAQVEAMTTIADETSTLPLTMHLHFQYTFIGSSLILTLMCFAWARALRSYSMAFLALYFSIKSLWILADGGISIVGALTDSFLLLKMENSLLAVLSIVILVGFTGKLFSLKKRSQKYYLLLRRLSLILIITTPVSYFLSQLEFWLLIQVLNSFSLIALLYVARKLSENQDPLPIIYSIMLLVQLSFNLVGYVLHFNRVPTQAVNCLDMLAFWFMALMVTYIMGRRYYGHLQDVKLAQQRAIASAKTSQMTQNELLVVQQEGQELLESRVQERTLELNIALQELETANQELQERNTLDELSGLYNRRHYDQKLLAEFRRSRRNLTPLSLILVDIDHFKKVNDSYGHLTGDKCIVETAGVIKALLQRSTDVGCRYGGEEFCLILPETDEKGAYTLAQEVCNSISHHRIFSNENFINLTVSCGVTTYQQEKDVTPEVIFASADKALYKAKQAGRNQVQVGLLSEI
ncbi:GGDEF domain-containing protein [Cognaticolwellia mytili]|uniref:GGDEF domain-containing protein n=1 Tax=Cognaticolwellia mytili TaxID=1888913 RepID=UPI001F162799|nr:diguanylate cyclase [Cognaticolwellia mytili]